MYFDTASFNVVPKKNTFFSSTMIWLIGWYLYINISLKSFANYNISLLEKKNKFKIESIPQHV